MYDKYHTLAQVWDSMPIPLFDQNMLHRKHYHNFGNDAKIPDESPYIGTILKDSNDFPYRALEGTQDVPKVHILVRTKG